MSCDGTRPDQIGSRVGADGKKIRAWLRKTWPAQQPGNGGQWFLTHDQVRAAIDNFSSKSVEPRPDDRGD